MSTDNTLRLVLLGVLLVAPFLDLAMRERSYSGVCR